MTDQPALTLDDVRLRFLDAQAQLVEAGAAVEAIRDSAQRLGAAREGLIEAGTQVAGLAERFAAVADAMSENAERLREGVDAIRLGDPAAIRREIEELDAAFTAMQSVFGERLGAVEATLSRLEAAGAVAQREVRFLVGGTLVAVLIVAVLTLVR